MFWSYVGLLLLCIELFVMDILFSFCSFLYFCAPDPVSEELLSENRKMITNEQIDMYNEAAVSTLNSSKRNAKARVRFLQASRQAAMETIAQSEDGLHLPEGTRNVVRSLFIMVQCL